MEKDKDLKLVKCLGCGKAFYLKIKLKGKIKLKCPFCEDDVHIKINGSVQNVSP